MRKVLFIAYDFPPCSDIGGSLRSEKFVKYLPRFGWQASVLCLSRHDPQVGKRYPCVHRIPSLTPWSRPYKITPYGWLPPLYLYGRRKLNRNEYDLIYVSCPPFPQTIVASRLKRLADIPLVIDFRDAWSLDPYVGEGSRLNKVLHKTLFPAVEKKVLTDVDYLIVNTPSALEAYLEKYPALVGCVTMIPNGYDEEDFVDYRPCASKRQMTLLYCGRFGVGGRNPISLLKALSQLVEENLPVCLRIIGAHGSWLSNMVAKLGLRDHVRLAGQIIHNKAIQAMADCDVMVLYQERSKAQVTPIAGKTYEYLRAGKAILAIAPPGDNLSIIRQYAPRHETAVDHDVSSIVKAIRVLHHDWEQGTLASYVPPPIGYLEQYSRLALTARLASLFDDLINRN